MGIMGRGVRKEIKSWPEDGASILMVKGEEGLT